ncbi:MAG: metallophosphoesterase [Deltaproteobacteria bacterium]|jgi:hypothetical protein|nr:metallophosphoesterase [Deltaproteobacteria bacterium]
MKMQKLLIIFPVLFVISCLNDYEKRASLDLKVGIWENEWSSWQVVDGLAQIKEDSTTNKIILWAQAPGFKIKVNTTQAATFQLICRNCLATSQLKFISSSDSTPLINQIPSSSPTEKQWDISNMQPDSQYILEVGETSDGSELAYKVAFFSDIQKEGMSNVEDIFENINNYGEIKFVFSAGDITHRGTPAEIEVFMEKLKTLEVPFYTTSGNHDVGWGEEKAWQKNILVAIPSILSIEIQLFPLWTVQMQLLLPKFTPGWINGWSNHLIGFIFLSPIFHPSILCQADKGLSVPGWKLIN